MAKYVAYTESNGYTFLNAVDSAPELYPLMMIEGRALYVKDNFTLDSVRSLMSVGAGYVIMKDAKYEKNLAAADADNPFILEEHTKQYSVKGFSRGQNLYFHKDFAAVVYTDSPYTHIYIHPDLPADMFESDPLYSVSNLLHSAYISNTFNEAIGRPPLTYTVLPQGIVQTIELDDVSGVAADFYAIRDGQLLAAYGLQRQMAAIVPLPATENCARAVRDLLDGKLKAKDGLLMPAIELQPRPGFGVLFTNEAKKQSAAFWKNMRNGFKDVAGQPIALDLAWSQMVPKPVSSGATKSADLLYLYRTKEALAAVDEAGVQPTGLLYMFKNGTSNLDTDLKAAYLNDDPTSVPNADGLLADSSINRILAEALRIYRAALIKAYTGVGELMLSQFETLRAALSEQHQSLELDVVRECLDNQGEIAGLLSACGNGLEVGGDNLVKNVDQIGYTSGIAVSIPDVEPNFSDEKQCVDTITSILSQVGGDMTFRPATEEEKKQITDEDGVDVEVPELAFGENCKASYRQAFRTAVGAPYIVPAASAVCGILKSLRDSSLNVLNNNCSIEKKALFIKKKYSRTLVDRQGVPVGLDRVGVKQFNISTIDGRCTITCRIALKPTNDEMFTKGPSSASVAKDVANSIARNVAAETGWCTTAKYLGEIGRHYGSWSPVFWFTSIPQNPFMGVFRCGKNRKGLSINAMPCAEHTIEFVLTKRMDATAQKIALRAPCGQFGGPTVEQCTTRIMNQAQTLATISMLKYLTPYVEELKATAGMVPICYVENTYVTPVVAKAFFSLAWLDDTVLGPAITALERQYASSGGSEIDKLKELSQILAQMRDNMLGTQGAPVTPVYWLTEADALNSKNAVQDTGVLPLFIDFCV